MSDIFGRVSGCVDGHRTKTTLTAALRKAAYPLPMGDCDASLLQLQYFAGAQAGGRANGRPELPAVSSIARVVKDIEKNPGGRGPTVRVKRDKIGSSQAFSVHGDMSALSGPPRTGSPGVFDQSRHKVSSQSNSRTSDLY
jgi:hypothetical protein